MQPRKLLQPRDRFEADASPIANGAGNRASGAYALQNEAAARLSRRFVCVGYSRFNFKRDGTVNPTGAAYIMPPPGIGGVADFSSGFSATMHSVVSRRLATEAAF